MTINITVLCPGCGEETELEIEMTSAPVAASGMSGPPDSSSPGEAAEWAMKEDLECVQCHAEITVAYVDAFYDPLIQERLEIACMERGAPEEE